LLPSFIFAALELRHLIVPHFTRGRTVSPVQHNPDFIGNQRIVSKKTRPQINRKVDWVRVSADTIARARSLLRRTPGKSLINAYRCVPVDGQWLKSANK
jgi:hypothetical protein